ncbi:MAG: molybdenum cofactor biosynthesis protein MoaE [Phycisphaera sp.]|nr:molybdenum cofactor biosynthesis protein MoaE [Phycisphaera sp.]
MNTQATTRRPFIHTAVHDGPVGVAHLDWPTDCGAEAVFIGRTRMESHAEFGKLLHLDYEIYEPMAVKRMDEIAREAVERFTCRAVWIEHARGVVSPGEASVVIHVGTPHRGEAFAACRYLIDRIKHELPIWKREVWERGTTFVEGCCAHRATSNGEPGNE